MSHFCLGREQGSHFETGTDFFLCITTESNCGDTVRHTETAFYAYTEEKRACPTSLMHTPTPRSQKTSQSKRKREGSCHTFNDDHTSACHRENAPLATIKLPIGVTSVVSNSRRLQARRQLYAYFWTHEWHAKKTAREGTKQGTNFHSFQSPLLAELVRMLLQLLLFKERLPVLVEHNYLVHVENCLW